MTSKNRPHQSHPATRPAILQASRRLKLGQAPAELVKQLRRRGWHRFQYTKNKVDRGYNVSVIIGAVVFGQPSVARSLNEAKHIACEHALSNADEWPQYQQLATTSAAFFLGKKPKGRVEEIVEKAKGKGHNRFAVASGTDPAIIKAINDAGGEIVVMEEKVVGTRKRKRGDDAPASIPSRRVSIAFRPAPAAERVLKRTRTSIAGSFALKPNPKPE